LKGQTTGWPTPPNASRHDLGLLRGRVAPGSLCPSSDLRSEVSPADSGRGPESFASVTVSCSGTRVAESFRMKWVIGGDEPWLLSVVGAAVDCRGCPWPRPGHLAPDLRLPLPEGDLPVGRLSKGRIRKVAQKGKVTASAGIAAVPQSEGLRGPARGAPSGSVRGYCRAGGFRWEG